MPCYKPLTRYTDWAGKQRWISDHNTAAAVKTRQPDWIFMTFPCGQCIGCRIDRSRSWAIRCVHEAQMHKHNSFITLTYDDEHLPEGGTLRPKDHVDFIKLLRYHNKDTHIRYFHAGEYGTENNRPHYHTLLFGLAFPDQKLWTTTKAGQKLYRSEKLESIWTKGFSSIGNVTWQSAAYTARYIMKKINGDDAEEHYESIDNDGVVTDLTPEYTHMSRNPGLGATWFNKYHKDIFPSDEVQLNGKRYSVPRYYDKLLELKNPKLLEVIKQKREEFAQQQLKDSTPERLAVREKCKARQIQRLRRKLSPEHKAIT